MIQRLREWWCEKRYGMHDWRKHWAQVSVKGEFYLRGKIVGFSCRRCGKWYAVGDAG